MDENICLTDLVKKDQLCAIALVKRKLKVKLKMVGMATSHSLEVVF